MKSRPTPETEAAWNEALFPQNTGKRPDHVVIGGVVTRSKRGCSGVPVDAYVEMHSKKRLVQTSPPYPTQTEALEAADAILQDDLCDYAYVTEDNRTVGIFDYYDVTPDQPVKPGQRRVRIPSFNGPDKQAD